QLQRVTITADDQDAVSVVLGLGGQRGNDVVGLETRLGEHGDAECDQHLLGDVDLSAEFVGCGRPACLVLRVLVDAEGLPGYVEGRGAVRRLFVAQQVDQHRGEAVNRVRGQPALGLEVLGGQ